MKLAIVGATGLVGSVVIKVLEELSLPINEVYFVASEKSLGKEIMFKNKTYKVISLEEAVSQKPDIAIFSAGSSTSLLWAPKFSAAGTTVIDNSSAWRMNQDIKLIVPEINGNTITKNDKIIANPNCSTIQLVMVLAPLHSKYKIKRIVVSTYQSVSGTGAKGIEQLKNERKGNPVDMVYPYPIDLNCLPHAGDFDQDGYTTEETKLLNETRKILNDSSINLTATAVRVPVVGGHSEAVNVEFYNDFDINEVKQILNTTNGVVLEDNPTNNNYPMPKYVEGKNEVFVGRIRRDLSQPKSLNLWISADNLRKGAATNAVQIAEKCMKL
jgi:aspartate-semialdehyde dehydrogenase